MSAAADRSWCPRDQVLDQRLVAGHRQRLPAPRRNVNASSAAGANSPIAVSATRTAPTTSWDACSDQQPAAVDDVGQRTRGQGQQQRRRHRRGLDEGDQRAASGSSTSSHCAPTVCIQVPIMLVSWAIHSARNARTRSGAHADTSAPVFMRRYSASRGSDALGSAPRAEQATILRCCAAPFSTTTRASPLATDWTAAGPVEVTTIRNHLADEDAVVAALQDVDVVVVMRERTPLAASVFGRLPRLRLVVTTGMRNSAIDLAAAAAHGVVVCGTASSPTPPTELTWALILGLARHVTLENASFARGGPWQSTVGVELQVAGSGCWGWAGSGPAWRGSVRRSGWTSWRGARTSPSTARRPPTSTSRRPSTSWRRRATCCRCTSPSVPRTRGILGRDADRRMRRTAFLVNTARSGLVDQPAMVDALVEGRIAGAGLDVFDEEPLPKDHVLRTLPTVLATPHLGYVAHDNYRTYFADAAEDIAAFVAGSPVRALTPREGE